VKDSTAKICSEVSRKRPRPENKLCDADTSLRTKTVDPVQDPEVLDQKSNVGISFDFETQPHPLDNFSFSFEVQPKQVVLDDRPLNERDDISMEDLLMFT